MSEYHVALDVDDTILGGPNSILRPHLETLFEFCASNFATISLLTLSRESECRRKLGKFYDKYVMQHIYAFPRKENNFSTNKDLHWIHSDISKVIMVEDPLAETLNIDWQQQKDRYIVVSAFDHNNPQDDNDLLNVIETMKKMLTT